MANVMKIRKVLALPQTYEPSTMYLVKSATAGFAEIYVSSSDGSSINRLPTRDDVSSMISNVLGSFSNITVVDDIAARDALTLDVATTVLVLDATGDATVSNGAATYIYDPATTTFYKVSEYESLDIVLDWANIQNKPQSAVADIDDAVTKRHTHANKSVLDDISDADGRLEYKGAPIRTYLEEEAW